MSSPNRTMSTHIDTALVIGGTGKTGRRVAQRLQARGFNTRIGSRSGTPAFDWDDRSGWPAVMQGVDVAYITYVPDLAVPGSREAISAFVEVADKQGIRRLVLLSGRGEEEAQACEEIVQNSGLEWTVVRASWFMQNFSEGEFLDMVLQGAITLPAADVPEPWIDINDIADVAVAAMTEEGHAGEVYEVSGPRLLTLEDLAAELAAATGRDIRFIRIPQAAFAEAIQASGAPADVAWLLNYLFETVLDGRNAYCADGVQRALGREPADFRDYARRVAARGNWEQAQQEVAA